MLCLKENADVLYADRRFGSSKHQVFSRRRSGWHESANLSSAMVGRGLGLSADVGECRIESHRNSTQISAIAHVKSDARNANEWNGVSQRVLATIGQDGFSVRIQKGHRSH